MTDKEMASSDVKRALAVAAQIMEDWQESARKATDTLPPPMAMLAQMMATHALALATDKSAQKDPRFAMMNTIAKTMLEAKAAEIL